MNKFEKKLLVLNRQRNVLLFTIVGMFAAVLYFLIVISEAVI